eukprot:2969791-Prymnesium_polylepis.1
MSRGEYRCVARDKLVELTSETAKKIRLRRKGELGLSPLALRFRLASKKIAIYGEYGSVTLLIKTLGARRQCAPPPGHCAM